MAQVNVNGIDVAYRLDGPAGGETVMLGNGLAMDLTMWKPQIAALSARYRVLSYDQRGHGGTSGTPGDYSLALLADDAAALLDRLGLRRAHLIGTSLGAMVWQAFALGRPDRTLSLSLCATTTRPPKQVWDARIAATRRTGLEAQADSLIEHWFTPDFHKARPDIAQRMRDMLIGTSVDGFIGCSAAIRDMTLADRINAIGAPTLVIAGDTDLATPLPELRFIAESIPGARLELIVQSAHMPTIEQPDDCNATILAFLDNIANSSGTGEVLPS